MPFRLEVFGLPIPQGSTKAFVIPGTGRAAVTSDNKHLRSWRHDVTVAARVELGVREPLDCPVELTVMFFLPRPKSAPKRVTEPANLPDLDKLVRSIGDSLTAAGVWRDDGRVVSIAARKVFAGGHRDPMGARGVPRAVIEVRETTAIEDLALDPTFRRLYLHPEAAP